jgi:type I restriction enzyme M protein
VITGEIKSQVDKVWNAFATGGVSNPLVVIEQFTYLLFLKRLDENQTRAENKANRTAKPVIDPVFPAGQDADGRSYRDFRWSRFKDMHQDEMFVVFDKHIFPFLRTGLSTQVKGEESSFARHMKDVEFKIPSASLLAKVVDLIDGIPMDQRDTKGDLYEYMLGKIATAGRNGQFRTPRHIIDLMVKMTAPQPLEAICDPAAGTAGFLVQAGEYLREHHPNLLTNPEQSRFFHHSQFHGYDSDSTMLRIGSMNMLLHGVDNPDITYRDSLADLHASEEEKYDVILANPPFAGSLDYENVAKDLLSLVKTKKTELLFLALFLRLLKPGGRAAVIVPEGVLFGGSTAHKALRKMLVEDHKLDGVVKLPSGVFRPYAGVSTAILFFTKTNSGGTDNVWFYDVTSDGFSLDDKRALLAHSDLGDVLARWEQRMTSQEADRARTEQSFLVPRWEIAENGYDLSLNRYKEVEHKEIDHKEPWEIIAEMEKLEQRIVLEMAELKDLIGG